MHKQELDFDGGLFEMDESKSTERIIMAHASKQPKEPAKNTIADILPVPKKPRKKATRRMYNQKKREDRDIANKPMDLVKEFRQRLREKHREAIFLASELYEAKFAAEIMDILKDYKRLDVQGLEDWMAWYIKKKTNREKVNIGTGTSLRDMHKTWREFRTVMPRIFPMAKVEKTIERVASYLKKVDTHE